MSLNLDIYRERMSVYGTSRSEDLHNTIFEDFEENPAYRIVIFNGKEIGVHMIDGRINTRDNTYNRYMVAKPPTVFKAGDLVTDMDGVVWLTLIENNLSYNKVMIAPCNHELTWINDNGELIVKDCIEDVRTLYTTGIRDDKIMDIPNAIAGITLPYDDDTKLLDRGTAFIFNKSKYRVTAYDETTSRGLVSLICEEIGLSHLDDKINEIADRWVEINEQLVDRLPWLDEQEPEPEPEPSEGISYSINATKQYESDVEFELSSNTKQTLKIKKYIDGEEVISDFIFTLSETINGLTLLQDTANSCILSTNIIYGKYKTSVLILDKATNEVVIEQIIKINGR